MKKHNSGRVRSGNPAKWRKRVALAVPAPTGLARLLGASSSTRTATPYASRPDRTRGADLGFRGRPGAATRATPPALAVPTSHVDRQALLILLAPFLIVAFSLATQLSMRPLPPLRQPGIAVPLVRPLEASPANVLPPSIAAVRPAIVPRPVPRLSVPIAPEAHPEVVAETLVRAMPATSPPTVSLPRLPAIALPPLPSLAPPAAPPAPKLASLARPLPSLPPVALPPLPLPLAPTTCAAPAAVLAGRAKDGSPAAISPGGFGRALAAAARTQLDDLVIYNARYARLSYPMGDVAGLYGVCTDVVVRAYRALGIDLQELIYTTKSGRGDIHIDHRRVDVIRRFFERQGAALAISDYAEDYQPGDIVTYYRPQNRTSTSHIAVVSDKLAPSGRLMIIHNRGWGPQLEDALFVDKITGHYRFSGLDDRQKAVPAAVSLPDAGRMRTPVPASFYSAGISRLPKPATVAAAAPQPELLQSELHKSGIKTSASLMPGRQASGAMCLPQAAPAIRENVREATSVVPVPARRSVRGQKLATARTLAAVVNR